MKSVNVDDFFAGVGEFDNAFLTFAYIDGVVWHQLHICEHDNVSTYILIFATRVLKNIQYFIIGASIYFYALTREKCYLLDEDTTSSNCIFYRNLL